MLKRLGQLIVVVLVFSGGYWLYTSVFAGGSISGADLNRGLVGYWSFEEGSGTVAGDMSGNGHDGTLTNMESSDWVSGKRGSALDFDGVNEKVDISNSIGSIPTQHTISMWYRNSDAPSGSSSDFPFTWSNQVWNQGIYMIWDLADSTYRQSWSVWDGTAWKKLKYTTSLAADTWHHLTYTFDGTNARAYLNGEEEIATTTADVIQDFGIETVVIGGSEATGFDDGIIDEVRIYNRALSHEEVRALHKLKADRLQATQENRLTNGLVGYWSFDGPDMDLGSSTSEVKDSSGGDNHGDWQNHATTTVPGKQGQAIYFDGTDDYIDLGDNVDWEPDGSTSFSVSLWFKEGSGHFISHSPQVASNYWYVASTDAFFCGSVACTVSVFSNYTPPNDNDWHHFVATLDRSTSPDTLTIYVDGVVEDESTGTLDGQVTSWGTNTRIGIGYWAAEVEYEGYMDEVRIYNRSLSADEVAQIYNIGGGVTINATQENKSTTGLVGHWSFDGPYMDWASTTAEVRDSTANSNHGDANSMSTKSSSIGVVGQALTFDGVSDNVRVDDLISTIQNDTVGSVSLWARIAQDDGTNNNPFAMGDSDGFDGWFNITYNMVNDTLYTQLRADGAAQWEANTAADSVDAYVGEWAHIVLVQDAVQPKMYVNAIEQALTFTVDTDKTKWMKAMIADATGKVDSVSIGQIYLNSASWSQFEGDIDEVRIYNVALTEEEILDMYTRESGTDRLDVGLVGYWPFRAGTSTVATDYSGNGNTGTLENMFSSDWVSGRIGYGIDVNGTTKYASLGDIDEAEGGTQITVAGWFRWDGTPGAGDDRTMVSKNEVFLLRQGNPGSNAIFYIYDTVWQSSGVSTTDIDDGELHHIVGVYDGDTVQVYVDGELENSSAISTTINSNSNPVEAGRFSAAQYWNGLMDEIRIYKRALSAAEVKALYDSTR